MTLSLPLVIAVIALIVIMLALLLRGVTISHTDLLQAPRIVMLSPELEGEVADLLVSGQKIEAIKRVREETDAGLKEAKDLIEKIEMRR